MNFRVTNIRSTPELVDDVIKLGDSQKNTLGFLPEQAFFEYADKGSILIALSQENELAGYVLFANKQNSVCRLAHVCVDAKFRKNSVGCLLIDRLKNLTMQMDRIIAKCRRDYGIDQFWEKNGFIARGEVPGRGLGDTTLTLWEYIHRPSLLSLPPERSKPLAVLDLSVVIDVDSHEENECKALLSFTYADEIDFRASTHSYVEANRNGNKITRNVTRNILNSLKKVKKCEDQKLIQSVLNIIGNDNVDDASQIASAIESNADFFITRDARLTGFFESIQKEFGLNVYSPTEFIVNYCNGSGRDLYFPGFVNSTGIVFKAIKDFKFTELFHNYKAPDEKKHLFNQCLRVGDADVTSKSYFKIFIDDEEIGVCVQSKDDRRLTIRLLRLKHTQKHLHTIATHVVENILYNAISIGVDEVLFSDTSSGRFVEQALVATGFKNVGEFYVRPIARGFISAKNAMKLIGISENYKLDKDHDDIVNIETALWPAKIYELEIPVYIVPIKPRWAKNLISTKGHQLSLLGTSSAMLQTRRVYYRSRKGIEICAPGRVFWYATGNTKGGLCKCCVGISLINSVEIDTASALFKKYERFGVYNWKDILAASKNDKDAESMVILFSKTEVLLNFVSLNSLNDIIKSVDGKQFNPVSPFRISQNAFVEIYRQGAVCGH